MSWNLFKKISAKMPSSNFSGRNAIQQQENPLQNDLSSFVHRSHNEDAGTALRQLAIFCEYVFYQGCR